MDPSHLGRPGAPLITLDTSALFALVDRRQETHERTRRALLDDPGPYLVPVGILSEVAYLLESRLGREALDAVLADVEEGAYSLDCGEDDLGRIRDLTERYADLPLGYSDAAVIACAERNGGRVLTHDRRDFGVVARDVRIVLVPDEG